MKRVLIGLTLLLFLQSCTLFGIRNYEILPYNVLIEENEFQVNSLDVLNLVLMLLLK